MIRRYSHKKNKDIAKEWDEIASVRATQLNSHNDLSMDNVIIPMVLDLSSNCSFENVIDLGCGTGYVTKYFLEKSLKIRGIDISEASIKEARLILPNVPFETISIEEYSVKNKSEKFSLAISNMTFMDVANLEEVIKSTSNLLKENSNLILTITHPYFWPLYWGYNNFDWFDYSQEIEIEANFNISLNNSTFKTTHYHRPLETYINLLKKYNLNIIELREPMPNKFIMKKYPNKWTFPRFLGIKCLKTKANKM